MAGWLTQKLTIIFKGPWINYFAEVHEGRKSVIWVIRLRKLIAKTIPQDVVVKHNIEKAIKHQKKAVKLGKKVDKKTYMLAFRVELSQEKVLTIIHKILEDLEKARNKLKDRNEKVILGELEKHLIAELIRSLKEEDKEEAEIYWKYLEPVIKSAEHEKEAAMAKVAQLMKTKDISRLSAIAFKWEARAVRKGVILLRHDRRQLKGALSRLKKGGKGAEKAATMLKQIDKGIIEHAKNEFKSTYLMLKRDLLLDLVLLRFLNMGKQEMERFVGQRNMPREPEFENEEGLKKVKKEIAEHCHTIAQGLRRLIKEERDLIGLAKKEEALARAATHS